jgi:hypothetical protein
MICEENSLVLHRGSADTKADVSMPGTRQESRSINCQTLLHLCRIEMSQSSEQLRILTVA